MKYKSISWLLAGLMFFFTVLPPGSAWAQRKTPTKPGGATTKYGKIIKELPAGHRLVRVGNTNYHYRNGIFYLAKGRHWVVVRPPIGAIVTTLTTAAILVTISGIPYYLCEGIYYRKVPAGYEVVEVQVQPVVATSAGKMVQVTAQLLNIRSGPGKHHGVSGQIPKGTILTIKGQAPDWLYIELEDGTSGWVMKKFTVIVKPAAAQG